MNPPVGGKEGKEAKTHFTYKTGATQVLFVQHVIDYLTFAKCQRGVITQIHKLITPMRIRRVSSV